MLSIIRDITERFQVEQRLRLIVDSAKDYAMISMDNRGSILSWSSGAERLFGYREAEIVDRLELEYALEAGYGENERWHLRKDGSRFYASGTVRPIQHHGQVYGFVKVVSDTTQRLLALERLNRLQEITSELSRHLTLDEVVQVIVTKALASVGAVFAGIALLDQDQTALEMVHSHNINPSLLQTYRRLPLDKHYAITDAVRSGDTIWLSDPQEYGRRYPESYQATLQQGIQALACIPLIVEGQIIGGMSLAFGAPQAFERDDRDFFVAIVQQRVQEAAVLEERHRLARDLHDAVSQTLLSATTIGQSLPLLMAVDSEKALHYAGQMVALNQAAMAEMRTLLLELRPEAIVRTSLAQLFQQLLDAARGRKPLQTQLIIEGKERPLPPQVHVAFYRIAQEAINNSIKHSKARKLLIYYSTYPDKVVVRIVDDGVGFDMAELAAGMGLNNMRERAASVGASVELASSVGEGTTILLQTRLEN
jgi:signal transduction histidine kinase